MFLPNISELINNQDFLLESDKKRIELIKNFDNDNWMLLYIFWELLIIRELGFDPDFNKFKSNINDLDKIYDLEIDRIKYKVPGFLIKNKIPNNINDDLIRKSLIFNRSLKIFSAYFLSPIWLMPISEIIILIFYKYQENLYMPFFKLFFFRSL